MTREERDRRAAARQLEREARVDRWITRNGLRPRYAAYLVIATWLVAVLAFGIFQRLAEPETYPSIWLAWWWAIQTVTTVGYGDVVPQEPAGKAVAAILMIGGLAVLSVLTATITSSFVARRQERARAQHADPIVQAITELSAKVDSLEAELNRSRGGREGG